MAVGVYGGRLGLTSAEARTVYRQAQRIVRSVAFFVRRNARRKCDRRSFRAAGAVRLAGSTTLGALHDDRPGFRLAVVERYVHRYGTKRKVVGTVVDAVGRAYSFPSFRILSCSFCSPQRASGVWENSRSNWARFRASHCSAFIRSSSGTGRKALFEAIGARRLCGQARWHRSQPKIHPCSSPSSPSPRSMVRREMQREASILRPGRMAPAGHASMQRWQFPQPSGTVGRPASSSAVVTISPSSTNDPKRRADEGI